MLVVALVRTLGLRSRLRPSLPSMHTSETMYSKNAIAINQELDIGDV